MVTGAQSRPLRGLVVTVETGDYNEFQYQDALQLAGGLTFDLPLRVNAAVVHQHPAAFFPDRETLSASFPATISGGFDGVRYSSRSLAVNSVLYRFTGLWAYRPVDAVTRTLEWRLRVTLTHRVFSGQGPSPTAQM